MKKVLFGKTGYEVSEIVLGCWGLGSHFFGPIAEKQVVDTVHAAIDNGINLIDTAPNYGDSEDQIGKAIKGIPRDKFYIATKTGNVVMDCGVTIHLAEQSIRYQVENSLRRMGIDYIDLLQVHWPDYNHSMPVAYAVINKLVEEGKIRKWGVCNHHPQEVLDAFDVGATMVQNNYSLTRRAVERDVFPIADAAGMGTEAFGILDGGFLTGKFTEPHHVEGSERRSLFYTELKAENWERGQKVLKNLKEVADGRGVSMAQIAINWVLHNPHVQVALVGAKTPEQVISNIGAASFTMTDEEYAKLNAVKY